MATCPGCGLELLRLDECDRCEYFNLAANNGRYHYCGEQSCYCRNLPGLRFMLPEVRERFIEQHRANMAAVSAPVEGGTA